MDKLFYRFGTTLITASAVIVVIWAVSLLFDRHTHKPSAGNKQITGHISSDGLKNGITVIDIDAHGRRITCIVSIVPGSSGGWAGGNGLSCDWGR